MYTGLNFYDSASQKFRKYGMNIRIGINLTLFLLQVVTTYVYRDLHIFENSLKKIMFCFMHRNLKVTQHSCYFKNRRMGVLFFLFFFFLSEFEECHFAKHTYLFCHLIFFLNVYFYAVTNISQSLSLACCPEITYIFLFFNSLSM